MEIVEQSDQLFEAISVGNDDRHLNSSNDRKNVFFLLRSFT